mgnify:CR=1 FL=1
MFYHGRMRIAMAGAGFWASYQAAAWREIGSPVAWVVDPSEDRARSLAEREGARWTTSLEEALQECDVLDVVAPVEHHATLVRAALAADVPVICQKPLATSLAEAEALVAEAAGKTFLVHENYRWQAPFRALLTAVDAGRIGTPFRARLRATTGYDVFGNQPAMRELMELVIADVGSHVLDMARRLLGEAEVVGATTASVAPGIRGEDVATILMRHRGGATSVTELGFPGVPQEDDPRFETLVLVEGSRGTAELRKGGRLTVTNDAGSTTTLHPPVAYPWCHPDYVLSMSAMVPCLADLRAHLRGETNAETTATDNLATVRLVFASYEAARR